MRSLLLACVLVTISFSPCANEAPPLLEKTAAIEWQVPAFPLLHPDVGATPREGRKQPIWNEVSGKRRLECRLTCPPGAKMIHLPEKKTVMGAEGMKATVAVEALEEEGKLVLLSVVEYEIPLVVGTDRLAEYGNFLDALWSLSTESCQLEVPQEKSLEGL